MYVYIYLYICINKYQALFCLVISPESFNRKIKTSEIERISDCYWDDIIA